MSATLTAVATGTLVAVTEQAKAALGDKGTIAITRFPFQIGRENRSMHPIARLVSNLERRLGSAAKSNDLYLIESPFAERHQISREHCAIECEAGEFFLVDRGSACGCSVVAARPDETQGSSTIERSDAGGGRRGGRLALRDGDLIVIGTHDSPYVFRFAVVPAT